MTKNPRINVTFDDREAGLLAALAIEKNQSLASLVRELTMEAIDLREDAYLSKLAAKLDIDGAKTYSHKDAWK